MEFAAKIVTDATQNKIRIVLNKDFIQSIVTIYGAMNKKILMSLINESESSAFSSTYNHKMVAAYCNAAILFIEILAYGNEQQKLEAIRQMNDVLKSSNLINPVLYSKLCYFLVESDYTHYLLLE
jgi:hypothetical protein